MDGLGLFTGVASAIANSELGERLVNSILNGYIYMGIAASSNQGNETNISLNKTSNLYYVILDGTHNQEGMSTAAHTESFTTDVLRLSEYGYVALSDKKIYALASYNTISAVIIPII